MVAVSGGIETSPQPFSLPAGPALASLLKLLRKRLNLGNLVSLGFNAYYYWLFDYEGSKGKSRIGILKPFITVRLYKNISAGFEHHIYYDNRFIDELNELHLTTTEQKVFVQIFFQDRRRYGKYH